jgi:hypothetical protein
VDCRRAMIIGQRASGYPHLESEVQTYPMCLGFNVEMRACCNNVYSFYDAFSGTVCSSMCVYSYLRAIKVGT